MRKKNTRLRRANVLLAALLMICSCTLSVVSPTWAWFTDRSNAPAAQIQAARFDLLVSITDASGATVTVTPQSGADLGTYYQAHLSPGQTYAITLTRTQDTNAALGYCQIYAPDGGFLAVTDTVGNTGYTVTLTPGASDGTAFRFVPTWGQYSGQALLIENGAIIGAPADPEETEPEITEPEVTEPEVTEPEITEPEPTESEPTEPEPTGSAPTDPEETEPEPTGSAPTEPESTKSDPEPTGPEVTEPPETEPVFTEPPVDSAFGETAAEAALYLPAPSDGEEGFQDYQLESSGFTSGEMPLYFQTDYPDTRYGAGTIASSGCGITCLAMVASYLTDHPYLPDQLADYFGGTAENNMARLENGSTALQLPWSRAENFDYTMAALEEGKIVIALMQGYDGDCLFTQTQHFIVLKGLNEEGKVLVHDPYAPNYEKWDLKQGFENGFSREQLLPGYSGGWIYDPAQMPEEPFIYEEYKPYVECRYPGVYLTWADQQLLAKVIWVEARGECAEGQQAVAEVVLNRLVSGKFGSTISEVIYGEGQFRSVPYLDEAQPYQAQYDALDDALAGPYITPIDVYYFATTPPNTNVWATIGNHVFCYAPT